MLAAISPEPRILEAAAQERQIGRWIQGEVVMDVFQPRPEHHFTFGLWTVEIQDGIRSATRSGSHSTRSKPCTGWPTSAHMA